MMIIKRAADAAFLNQVLNHPDVRPWVADMAEGPLDLSPAIANPNNVCLIGRHGAFMCFKVLPARYEVHTQVLPEGRGQWAAEFAQAGARYMFCATDAVEILTRVPQGHVAATALTRAMRFDAEFVTPPECLFLGRRVPATIYSLSLQAWAKFAPKAQEEGAKFHEWLNSQCGGTPHPPDEAHNRIVGVSLAMIRAGQVAKGCAWYNRSAVLARHPSVELLGTDPPRVRFDAGVLVLEDGEIRLETC